MISNQEMAREVLKRARSLKARRQRQAQAFVLTLATVACLAVIITTALRAPAVTGALARPGLGAGAQGALFLDGGAIGFVVVGVFAFLLGIAVTLLAVLMKKKSGDAGLSEPRDN